MKLLKLALFCFGDNYIKFALYTEMLSPYLIELYKAIYKNVFLIIFSIPFIFLKTNDIYIFVFIGALIYNEVLIINKCGLNMNTILYMNDKFNKEKDIEEINSNDDANDINDDNDNTDENSSIQLEHSFA